MKQRPMSFTLHHLFEVPQHRDAVAALIHNAFWTQVPGASSAAMAARIARAQRADAMPLCLVALQDSRPAGVVNLVEEDDEGHPEWHPWLAGMVVRADLRGRGIGSALVRELLDHAWRLGLPRVYFGTDGPGFYTRLGAVLHEQPRPDFCFMRFDRP